MNHEQSLLPAERIEKAIYVIRGHRVLLDRNLASLYGVETRALVQAVKRNIKRFPEDFMFQLNKKEFKNWRSQIVISNSTVKMGLRWHPYAFTEQGVAMLSSVLHSPQAVAVNIDIMRAFVRLRQALSSHHEIAKKLAVMESFLLKNSSQNSQEFRRVWAAIEKLSTPSTEKGQRKMGFDLGQ